MALVTGRSAGVEAFYVVEARFGHYELARDLAGGGVVRFSASSEGKVLGQAADWVADQARRSDGGALA